MDISIIVPFLNEAESLPELIAWIQRVMQENRYSYEVLLIDDGSTDNSWETVRQTAASDTCLHGIRFRRNYGKSAALYEGFAAARGDIVVTMDADLQDSPEEIPEMVRMIREEGYDLVSGWKKHRKDNAFTKNIPSKLYNWTARRVTGIKLHDMNCGLKAYRSEVVKNIEVYGEMISTHGDSLLAIPVSNQEPDVTAFVLEALTAESYYTVYPAFFNVVMMGKCTRDPESRDMLEIIFQNRTYDIGLIYGLGDFAGNYEVYAANHFGDTGFASLYKSFEPKINEAVETLNELIDEWNG